MNAGIGIDQDALGGKPLRAVAGDRIAMIEVAMLSGIEFDLPVVVEAGSDSAIGCDRFDDGKVAIGNAKRLVRSGELDAVADGKLARRFPDRR